MKRTLLILFLFLLYNISFSQDSLMKKESKMRFGLSVSIDKSYFNGYDYKLNSFQIGTSLKYVPSWLINNSYFNLGLLYNHRSLLVSEQIFPDNTPDAPGYGLSYNYIEFPLSFSVNFIKRNTKIKPILSTGIMPALLVSGRYWATGFAWYEKKYNLFKGYNSTFSPFFDFSFIQFFGISINNKKHSFLIGLQSQNGIVQLTTYNSSSEVFYLVDSKYKRFYNAYSFILSFYF